MALEEERLQQACRFTGWGKVGRRQWETPGAQTIEERCTKFSGEVMLGVGGDDCECLLDGCAQLLASLCTQ
jgi:hypothetical protein